jgi:tetratricopeptide (TPR) repeat protein
MNDAALATPGARARLAWNFQTKHAMNPATTTPSNSSEADHQDALAAGNDRPLHQPGRSSAGSTCAAPATAADLSTAYDHYRARGYRKAEALARERTAADPHDLLARTLLAATLYKQNRLVEALDQVDKALASWPDDEDLAVLKEIFMQALAAEQWVSRLTV